ncbi:MAG: YncE family protein [Thermomicrobiales bacterium]
MSWVRRLVGIVAVTVLGLGATAHADVPAAPARDFVAIEERGVVHVVDPATGDVWEQLGGHGALASVAATSGHVYVSVASTDGSGTMVFAIWMPTAHRESIGHLPEVALANRLSPTGDRLYVTAFVNGSPITTPSATISLPLPDGGLTKPDNTAARDAGGGVLSPEGTRWYRLRTLWKEDRIEGVELQALAFQEGGTPIESTLRLPMSDYHSLLMAPNGRTLFAVDYGGAFNQQQTIHVIDAGHDQPTLARSIAIQRGPTKALLCQAALSPQGDRLYVASHDGPARHGILVFDTDSWERVAHLRPDDAYRCLVVSPDGDRLYGAAKASGGYALVTIDARTGAELRHVPLELDSGCCPSVLLAVASE